jgi:hypothetical protein
LVLSILKEVKHLKNCKIFMILGRSKKSKSAGIPNNILH